MESEFRLTGCAKSQPVKARRLIFNCDGGGIYGADTENIEDVDKYVFEGKENVAALFWCDGAGGNTANYDSEVLELNGSRIGKVPPKLLKWIEEGNDPPKIIVQEARKRGLDVFYSFRINDIHDSFIPEELASFKIAHPEWLIDNSYYGASTALNFAIPEVRDLKLRVIEEIFEKYDFDGIEIDFKRASPFFQPFHEYRNRHFLTDFLRIVRESLNERGKERGREIELAVRVNENLEACKLDGFDVETWVKKGLSVFSLWEQVQLILISRLLGNWCRELR